MLSENNIFFFFSIPSILNFVSERFRIKNEYSKDCTTLLIYTKDLFFNRRDTLTGSRTPASGTMKPSSPALCTVFSRDLSSWSTGAHSPRAARPRSLWAPSLAVAPAELGLLPGCDGSPPAAAPLLPVEAEPSSLPPDGLSSLLEGFFLSSLPPGGFLLLLLMLRRTRSPREHGSLK